MQSLSSRILSESELTSLYDWAEWSPSAVLKCTCRQVCRIKTLPSVSHALGGQNLFLHFEMPGVVAEVCGMVVGMNPKEDQVTYEVDDGTAVLRVIETRKSLRQAESRSAKSGPSATALCGVPECYIMPAQAKESKSSSRPDYLTLFLPPLNPRFEVGNIVRCTGKIQIDRSGDKYLFSQRLVLCENVNMEAHHQLQVIKLEEELYRHPFDWRSLEPVRSGAEQAPAAQNPTSNPSARCLLSDCSQDERAISASAMDFVAEEKGSAEMQRISRDEARKLLSGDAPFLFAISRATDVSQAEAPQSSERSRSSQVTSRQLRAHDKISDRKLTESYFQLQLQQHITLRCRCNPFSISDLWSDKDLSSLARRLVRIRLQHRSASRSAGHSRQLAKGTSEQHAEKSKRLFEWAVRKMMHDGFIALAETTPSLTLDAPAPGTHEEAEVGADRYCLVTAEYLLKPLRLLLGSNVAASAHSAGSEDIDDLTARLRILDDRFRFVDRSMVQESLALLSAHRAPIVID